MVLGNRNQATGCSIVAFFAAFFVIMEMPWPHYGGAPPGFSLILSFVIARLVFGAVLTREMLGIYRYSHAEDNSDPRAGRREGRLDAEQEVTLSSIFVAMIAMEIAYALMMGLKLDDSIAFFVQIVFFFGGFAAMFLLYDREPITRHLQGARWFKVVEDMEK